MDEVYVNAIKHDVKEAKLIWLNGYNFEPSLKYRISNNLKSGIYYFENSSPFVIKGSGKADVLVVYPSNTDNAYNKVGGRNFYTKPKADTLSFKRPFLMHRYAYPFFQWIVDTDFEVEYACDFDLDSYETFKNYKVIVFPGHNEYWTRKAKLNFDRYIAEGGNVVILSGNTMWWQIRYAEDYSKMICLKGIGDSLEVDSLRTINWNHPSLNSSLINSIGCDFSYGGYGNRGDKGWGGFKIIEDSPLFDNTNTEVGDIISVLSAEYDGMPLLNIDTNPTIDTSLIHFYKIRLLGYDRAVNSKNEDKNGVFIVFQNTNTSGIVINAASTNWCSESGIGGVDGERIKKLTYNFIDFLVTGKSVF